MLRWPDEFVKCALHCCLTFIQVFIFQIQSIVYISLEERKNKCYLVPQFVEIMDNIIIHDDYQSKRWNSSLSILREDIIPNILQEERMDLEIWL